MAAFRRIGRWDHPRVLVMSANILPRFAVPLTPIREWWQSLERARKLTAAVSLAVGCGVVYACAFVASQIEQAFCHKAAAATPLYMGGFAEPPVAEVPPNAQLPAH